jgi:hydrogenase nickel incorporation protein HypB
MKINVVKSVLDASDALAGVNRRRMDDAAITCINILSAPGSGKTTLLQKSLPTLPAGLRTAVLVGDLQTTRDAERLETAAAQVVQINTGNGCHLSPSQVQQGLDAIDLGAVDLLFIENVGNMVCPAAFDLGEHRRVVLLSVPEGDDKVAKYPTLFQKADVILLTKIDLAELLEYNFDRVYDDLSHINTAAPVIRLSSKTGQGMEAWRDWLVAQRQAAGRK